VVGWKRVETNVMELGPHSVLLLSTPEGWRFLSNTIHD